MHTDNSIVPLRAARTTCSLQVFIGKLEDYFRSANRNDALSLLNKAIDKAQVDCQFHEMFEAVFTSGSTLEIRDLFEHFGSYWEPPKGNEPYYPHRDAVNMIDTAVFHVRIGHKV